jgi:hypothetical protein
LPYFSEMPTFNYPDNVGGKLKLINSRNILVRAKIVDYIKNTQVAYVPYTIRDGDRPETIAYSLYGRSDLHWLVLLFNEIIDPLFEWPISSHDMENLVSKTYTGKTLFVDLKRVTYTINGVLQTPNKTQRDVWYEIGGKVTQGEAEGTVIHWDPNLYKLVVKQDTTTNFKVTPNITNPFSEIRDLIHTRSDGVGINIPVGRVVQDDRYAVHHFEDVDTGDVVDHHAKIQISDGSILDFSLLDRYAVYGVENLILPNRNVVAVTNYQYEVNKNDAKRNIKIMRPDLIDVVLKDMRRIFSA